MYATCMASKTISIDLEAYEALRRAKLTAKDSFSQVIKRAKWDRLTKTCGDLLESLSVLPTASNEVLERLERAQSEDAAPDHPWA